MRGIYTPVIDIRRKVFTEVARMSYEGGNYAEKMTTLPFKIVPGEIGKLRHNIFLERAIVSERIRLAMGLPLRPVDTQMPASAGVEHSAIAEKYYDPPLINVIKFACNSCPEKLVKVTSMCQGCLAHPCQEVCPKKAISFRNGLSHIDQDLGRLGERGKLGIIAVLACNAGKVILVQPVSAFGNAKQIIGGYAVIFTAFNNKIKPAFTNALFIVA